MFIRSIPLVLIVGGVLVFWNVIRDDVIVQETQLNDCVTTNKTLEEETVVSNQNSFQDAIRNAAFPLDQVTNIFPKPRESVKIYNVPAWKQLNRVMTQQAHVTICANGGSVTAGGHLSAKQHRYQHQLRNLLLTTRTARPNATIQVMDRGHGSRNSFHSALHAESYFLPTIDLLLWEFSVNDASRELKAALNFTEEEFARFQRNSLLAWLNQVSRIQPRPPFVILVYLWQRPFRKDNHGDIVNPVFDAHDDGLAAAYDFVVGHVNVPHYFLHELDMLPHDVSTLQETFLVDGAHPNGLGHAVIAHLIQDLLLDSTRADRTSHQSLIQSTRSSKTKPPTYIWACGDETPQQQLLKQHLLDKTTASLKPPRASFTMELPKNEHVHPGMLLYKPPHDDYMNDNTTTILLGVADPLRDDRQYALVLPCCKDDTSKQLEFVVPIDQTSLDGASTIQFGLDEWHGPLSIFVNDQQRRVRGTFVASQSWKCEFASQPKMYRDLHWFVSRQEWKNVTSIQICSRDECCHNSKEEERQGGGSSTGSCSKLLSMVIF